MTRIVLDTKDGVSVLRCNGCLVAYDPRITSINQVSAGRWQGTACGYPFTLIGGKASGGASNEWSVKWKPNGDTFMHVNSAQKALRCIEFC